MRKSICVSLFLIIIFTSCDVVKDVASTLEEDLPLTEDEVVRGLKEALRVSTDTAVNIVSAVNGYYMDNLIRITLPPEADVLVKNKNNPLLQAAGIDKLIDDAVIRLNRAAENAAKSATPIFVDAIKSMTITDAFNILNGTDTSATAYFRKTTYRKLESKFKPQITSSLQKPLFGPVSASETWYSLTGTYNDVARFTGWKKVETRLEDYVTKKALNGLFEKIKQEEKAIRKDPKARVNDILERVFGN